jgi:hypothetical protein
MKASPPARITLIYFLGRHVGLWASLHVLQTCQEACDKVNLVLALTGLHNFIQQRDRYGDADFEDLEEFDTWDLHGILNPGF